MRAPCSIATTAPTTDAAPARSGFAREENVFIERVAERVTIRAHRIVRESAALPRFYIGATREAQCAQTNDQAKDGFGFHITSSRGFRFLVHICSLSPHHESRYGQSAPFLPGR